MCICMYIYSTLCKLDSILLIPNLETILIRWHFLLIWSVVVTKLQNGFFLQRFRLSCRLWSLRCSLWSFTSLSLISAHGCVVALDWWAAAGAAAALLLLKHGLPAHSGFLFLQVVQLHVGEEMQLGTFEGGAEKARGEWDGAQPRLLI